MIEILIVFEFPW